MVPTLRSDSLPVGPCAVSGLPFPDRSVPRPADEDGAAGGCRRSLPIVPEGQTTTLASLRWRGSGNKGGGGRVRWRPWGRSLRALSWYAFLASSFTSGSEGGRQRVTTWTEKAARPPSSGLGVAAAMPAPWALGACPNRLWRIFLPDIDCAHRPGGRFRKGHTARGRSWLRSFWRKVPLPSGQDSPPGVRLVSQDVKHFVPRRMAVTS